MLGVFPERPVGLLVGEGPGFEEVEQGTPFVGLTGEQLDLALGRVGLPRDRLALVNAMACLPIQGATEREKDKATECCKPLFESRVRSMVQHKIPTFVMGKYASIAVYGRNLVGTRGFIRDGHIIASWHPTFAFFYNPWELGAFLIDLDRFARLIRRELRPEGTEDVWPSVESLKKLLQQPALAFDIETAPADPAMPWTGKDPYRAKLTVLGFGTEELGLALDWPRLGGGHREVVRKILESKRILKVGWNIHWFDLPVLKRYGFTVNNVRDGRDMRRALSATSRLSLAHNVSLYDDSTPWKEDDAGDAKGMVFTAKRKELLRYNGQDCWKTARIHTLLKAEPEWGTTRVQNLYKMHTRMSKLAARMHKTGLYVLEDNRRFMVRCLRQEIREAEKRFCAMAHVTKCTPDVLRALLFKRHAKAGIPCKDLPNPGNPKMYTDEGMRTISVKEPVLLLMMASGLFDAETIPLLDAFWDVQQPKKRIGVLASDAFRIRTDEGGRFHPSWNSSGAETMRWTCGGDDPDLNVMAMEQLLRACFGAPHGRRLVHMDKSQLELRVMEVVADDPALALKLNTGDVYSADAIEWFSLPVGTNVKKDKPAARKACKIVRLGSQYQAGLGAVFGQALLQDRTIKFDLVRTLYKKFHETHHDGLDRYAREELAKVSACGYSEGRLLQGRRIYPAPPPITEVANYPIQRTAGEMMNLEILELEKALDKHVPSAAIVVQLHDAFDVECDEDDVEEVKAILKATCDREYTIDGRTRPFPVEIKDASDWSEL